MTVYNVNLNEVYQKLLELQREVTQLHQEINRQNEILRRTDSSMEEVVKKYFGLKKKHWWQTDW